jgi:hypothetical protein
MSPQKNQTGSLSVFKNTVIKWQDRHAIKWKQFVDKPGLSGWKNPHSIEFFCHSGFQNLILVKNSFITYDVSFK